MFIARKLKNFDNFHQFISVFAICASYVHSISDSMLIWNMTRVHACLNTCVIKFATHSTGDDYGSANDVPDLLQLLNQNKIYLVYTTASRAHDFQF